MKDKNLITALYFSGFHFTIRLIVACVAGIAIAGSLTLFMHVLIEFSQQELSASTPANFLDFVRVKREETSERKKQKPKRPKNQQAPPAPPTPQSNDQSFADGGLQVSIPTASSDININVAGSIGTGDGEYLPIVKVAPGYPVKAAMEGIEGSCFVEFTVTVTGATKDARAVPGKCPPVFARPSVAAAKKFKYKPRVVDGVAIEVPNVVNRFDYNLQSQERPQ